LWYAPGTPFPYTTAGRIEQVFFARPLAELFRKRACSVLLDAITKMRKRISAISNIFSMDIQRLSVLGRLGRVSVMSEKQAAAPLESLRAAA
jgi:hypothetical protein